MRRLIVLSWLLPAIQLIVSPLLAAPRGADRRQMVDARYGGTLTGQPVGLSQTKADTVVLLLSDFEIAPGGGPSEDGWTHIDRTQRTEPNWHLDTFNCAILDPTTIPNHAWWCGAVFSSCGGGDPAGGYGNGWEEYLDWYGEVDDPEAGTGVLVEAVINYDNEPGYDILYLKYENETGMATTAGSALGAWNGYGDSVVVAETATLTDQDYVAHPTTGNPSVHLRWQFRSDGGWSDQDCSWPTAGAAQLDLIEVSFDQGGGYVQQGWTEDCDLNPTQWFVTYPDGVGDFAKVWPLLDDADPCNQDNTPQFAFIDDGEVVAGTGGSTCISWCYGPGGYIVTPTGGLAGPEYGIHNEIWSPILDFPAGYDGCLYEYDVYFHEEVGDYSVWPGIFFIWGVRSINDDDAEPTWSGWRDMNLVYYGGPGYGRASLDVTPLLVSGRTRIQASFGAYKIVSWPWQGLDGTPAPYFDNAAIRAFTFEGPSIATREIDLFNDNFPGRDRLAPNGTEIDYANPGNNDVRLDMANNIALPTELYNMPGDSICVNAAAVRTGTQLVGNPELVYRLKANPIFDPWRTSGLPTSGRVVGDSARTAVGNAVEDRFCFDLPDTDFFYPGDILHYYFRATDTGGGTTTLPGDTTGFSFFPGMVGYKPLEYSGSFTVRGLPTLNALDGGGHLIEGAQPKTLWWDDCPNWGLGEEWLQAWYSNGYVENENLDIYYTNAPGSLLGNGLGGRATAPQLAGYDAIFYSSGGIAIATITAVDYDADPGDDVGVLDGWLRQGDKGLFLSGDDIVYDLQNDPAQLAFENTWIQVNLASRDLNPLINLQATPTVQPLPMVGNPVFVNATRWIAGGGCPALRTFDAVTPEGNASMIAEFLGTGCETSRYPYAAAIQTINGDFNANVIYLPYDLGYVLDDTRCGGNPIASPFGVRGQILRDALLEFSNPVWSPVTDAPGPARFALEAAPNPFNPKTTIGYVMPAEGRLTVALYDIRGRLVTTLHDGIVAKGASSFAWEAGPEIGSGVYFIRAESPFGSRTIKTAVVK